MEILEESNTGISARPIRRRLNEVQLFVRITGKKLFVNLRNRELKKQFLIRHKQWTINQWKNVLWSDEAKIKRLGSDGRLCLRRSPDKEFDPKFTEIILNHGVGSIMVWECFSWRDVGPIYRIKEIMDHHMYINIYATLCRG